MTKTLCQIQVDPAAGLALKPNHLGLLITPHTNTYEILVQDESLVAQLLNHQKVNGSISNLCVEVEQTKEEPHKLTFRPMPLGQSTSATLILFPQRAWVKRFF